MNLNAGSRGRAVALSLCIIALASCTEAKLGVHFLKSAARTVDSASGPVSAPVEPASGASDDRLAPARFHATGTAVWDGAATLEGVWIAHPRAARAERVRILNIATGETVEGAMFRRDPAMPGPPIVVSSDAARALGLSPGTPAELEVTALENAAPSSLEGRSASAANPVEAPAPPAPAPIQIDPVAQAPERTRVGAAPQSPAPASPAVLARSDANDAPPNAHPVGADEPRPAATAAPPAGRYLQVGSFGVAANAAALTERLRAGDQPSRRVERSVGGRLMSIVLIGPLDSADAVASAREAAAAEGIHDAIEVTL
ncbi:SPOR domain-containing protein [Pikeienuella piscinae]|uniref:SPOR domain-containing protein n=1 Tax=Pikeienuella piscinae TaxID=2748098 RepID=A0A7L5BWC0_9RHOB|nr:SPOR domain-containing protein [Pikeienuella piscinae]QIE54174.1 SPOR domain-containing protein [Pikeienuella piscinae]